jgi:hypothetical protein
VTANGFVHGSENLDRELPVYESDLRRLLVVVDGQISARQQPCAR